MRVTIPANELVNGDISHVSMVKHAASRRPFMIFKSEDTGGDQKVLSKEEAIDTLFGNIQTDSTLDAVLVRKSNLSAILPVMAEAGMAIDFDKSEVYKDIVILKSADAPEDLGQLVSLTGDVAVAVSPVSKFTSYPDTGDFDEAVSAASFFPGLHAAMDSFGEVIWQSLHSADTGDEAATEIAKQGKAFLKHIDALARNLPTVVFKMESLLQKSLGSSNLGSTRTDDQDNSKENNMSLQGAQPLKEVMGGDLDGLLEKSGSLKDPELTPEQEAELKKQADADAAAAAAASEPEGSVVKEEPNEPAEDENGVALFKGVMKVVVKGEVVEREYMYAMDQEKNPIFANWVKAEDTEEPVEKAEGDEAEPASDTDAIMKGLGDVAKGLIAVSDRLDKMDSKIEDVEKSSKEAIQKSSKTVLIKNSARGSLDESLQSLNGRLNKSDEPAAVDKGESTDIWKGILPNISALASQ